MRIKSGVVALVLVLLAGTYVLMHQVSNTETTEASVKNATYLIEGTSVTLVGGTAESPVAPGSAAKVITTYFGNEASDDLNGDHVPDTAFILTQTSGGSGTFYYVAAALKDGPSYQGTNTVLLGDRIAPQTTEIYDHQIVVNYADRLPGEPMTTLPSVGMSKYLRVRGDATLTEVHRAARPGEHCGGNMSTAAVCGAGYHCAPEPGSQGPFADVGGTCVEN